MCKWGTAINEKVTIPARLSYTGKARMAIKGIDACIAPFVRNLNANGVLTESSCCGHGKGYGLISLASGAEIHLPGNTFRLRPSGSQADSGMAKMKGN